MAADDLEADEERSLASSPRHCWFAAYLGRSYRRVVERALVHAGSTATILKADLWNERLGGERDVLGHLARPPGGRLVGVDLSHSVCAHARSRTAGLLAVQADIRALPFHDGSVDAVLDLSVLDHVDAPAIAVVIDEYRRVLRRGGTLVLVFWQRSAAVRLRLWLKRRLGLSEKRGQRYFSRAEVRASVGLGFAVSHELAAGLLLVLPMRAASAILGALPRAAVEWLVSRLAELEVSGGLRAALQHVAGLYGIIARAR